MSDLAFSDRDNFVRNMVTIRCGCDGSAFGGSGGAVNLPLRKLSITGGLPVSLDDIAEQLRIDVPDDERATLLAMGRSVAALSLAPGLVLVDGNDPPALPCPCEAIIGGDALVCSIAAASIIAKVTRDRMMARLGQRYPAYGFAGHAGYGTAKHRAAIKEHGPCPAHRYSFAPVKGIWFR